MNIEKRESTVTITVNEKEREALKKAAKEAKLTVSGYCRLVLFGKLKVSENSATSIV